MVEEEVKLCSVDLYVVTRENETDDPDDDERFDHYIKFKIGESEINLHQFTGDYLDTEEMTELLEEIDPKSILEKKKQELMKTKQLKKEIESLENLIENKKENK